MQIAETRQARGVAVPSIMYGTAWKEDRTQAFTSTLIVRIEIWVVAALELLANIHSLGHAAGKVSQFA